MPRGSKPGERRGGRQKGTPNKKTALINAAFAATASNPDISPLDFLLGVMRDPGVSPELRIKVAQAAAPFVHAKPGGPHPNDQSVSAIQIEGRRDFIIDPGFARALRDDSECLEQLERKFDQGGQLSAVEEQERSSLRARIAETVRAIGCPANYGPREAGKDRERLHHFHCIRISPPACGGGALSAAEEAEEAQATVRVAAYEESPEGRARSRIFQLDFADLSSGLSDAEAEELKSLRKIYPDLPLDPDDPQKDFIEALDRAAKEYGRIERSKAGPER